MEEIIKRIDDNVIWGVVWITITLFGFFIVAGIDSHCLHEENETIIQQNQQIIELLKQNDMEE